VDSIQGATCWFREYDVRRLGFLPMERPILFTTNAVSIVISLHKFHNLLING
jgi:hypothetical protein